MFNIAPPNWVSMDFSTLCMHLMMQSALLYTGVMIEYNILFSIDSLFLTMISGIGGNLLFRRDSYLIRILNKERSPPTE